MKVKNIFNRGLGFSGQLGKLGDILIEMLEDIRKIKNVAKVMITYSNGEKIFIPLGTVLDESILPIPEADTDKYEFDGWDLPDGVNWGDKLENDIDISLRWAYVG